VKHKSLKMLQLLYHSLMTQLCRTFMITLWIVNRFEKHSTNLEHCFTVSLTAYIISILSELNKCHPLDRTQAICWRPCHMSNSSATLWTRDWYM